MADLGPGGQGPGPAPGGNYPTFGAILRPPFQISYGGKDQNSCPPDLGLAAPMGSPHEKSWICTGQYSLDKGREAKEIIK